MLCGKNGFAHARASELHRGQAALPMPQLGVVGQINIERADADVALRRGMKIGARAGIVGRPCRTYPVHGFTMWVDLHNGGLRGVAAAQPGDLRGL